MEMAGAPCGSCRMCVLYERRAGGHRSLTVCGVVCMSLANNVVAATAAVVAVAAVVSLAVVAPLVRVVVLLLDSDGDDDDDDSTQHGVMAVVMEVVAVAVAWLVWAVVSLDASFAFLCGTCGNAPPPTPKGR